MMHNFNLLRNASIKMNKVSPMDNGTLVTFINNYLYAMIGILNDVVDHFEMKLINMNRRIDNITANLIILEMKLNSVSSTLSIKNDNDIETVEQVVTTAPEKSNTDKSNEDNVQTSIENHQQPTPQQSESNDLIESENVTNNLESNNNDENLEIYKRMLRFGVNENAVRQKMIIDGVEPSLLNL